MTPGVPDAENRIKLPTSASSVTRIRVGFDGEPSYLPICFSRQARSSRTENIDSERGGRPLCRKKTIL